MKTNLLIGLMLFIAIQSFTQTKWYKYPGNPVLRLSQSSESNNNVWGLAILYENDQYKMWYHGWSLTDVNLKHATSRDGIQWETYVGKPLKFGSGEDSWDIGLFNFDIIKVDSIYKMWYTTLEKETADLCIGYAWSEDGFSWKKHTEPVLKRGNKGDWDEEYVGVPQVVFAENRFYMWYTSSDEEKPSRKYTGLATSENGVHWEKHPANPVLRPEGPDTWDDYDVVTFCVLFNGSYFELWYNGSDMINFDMGYASSKDGINWNKSSENPVLRSGELGTWDAGWAAVPTVLRHDSVYRMWYQGTNFIKDNLGYATTSAKEAKTWDMAEINKPQRVIGVRVFNKIENINVDGLADRLSKLSGTELINAFNKLALAYSLNDTERSYYFAEKALNLAEKVNYPEGKALAYYSMGNSEYVLNDYSEALSYQLKALRLFDSLDMKYESGNLMAQIASIHTYTGSHYFATQYYLLAIENFEDFNDTLSVYRLLYHLGSSYLQNGDTLNAKKNYNKSYKLAQETGDILSQSYALKALGMCYSRPMLDSTLYYFDQANLIWDTLSTNLHSMRSQDEMNLVIAEAYYTCGPEYFEKAEEYYLKFYNKRWANIEQSEIRLYYGMADLYFNTNSYNKSRGYLNVAHSLCSRFLSKLNHQMYSSLIDKLENEIYLKSYMEKIYWLHYRLDTALHNKNLSFAHYKLATQWKDSIYNEQNRKKTAMMQGTYETESTQNRMGMLQKENEVKDMQIRQSRTFLFGMGGFLLLIIFMALLFIRQNKIRAEHKTLLLEQKMLRLQMNPHFIFNALSNIMNFIESKNIDSAIRYLANFSSLLRSTLESTRKDNIILEEEVNGLTNYLELQKLRYGNKFEYTVDVDDKLDPEEVTIPPMLIQPFIENAIEHGIRHKKTTGNIAIRFILKGKQVICEVEDDGVGRKKAWEAEYKTHKAHKSLATAIIMDRIHAINKKMKQKISLDIIDLKSNKDTATGTKVVICIPL